LQGSGGGNLIYTNVIVYVFGDMYELSVVSKTETCS
jgi:hypothetical protein